MTNLRMTRWPGVVDGGNVAPGAFMNEIFTASGSVVRGEADYASPGEAMGVSISRTANVHGYIEATGLNAPSASVTVDFDQPPAPDSGTWRFIVAKGAGGERLWGLDIEAATSKLLFRNAAQGTITAASESAGLVGVPKRICVYWKKGTTTANGTLRVRLIRLDTMATILNYTFNTAQNVGIVNLAVLRIGPEFTAGQITNAYMGFGNVGADDDPGTVTNDTQAVAALVQDWPAEIIAYDSYYSANGSTLVGLTTHYSSDGFTLT